jgi:aminoglycoside phosphotransferase (APT) family kinase protein
MSIETPPLQQMEVDYITDAIAPGGEIVAANQLEGGVSATITSLEYELPDQSKKRLIVRQYGAFDLADNAMIAADEEKLLRHLHDLGLPVPEPLLSMCGFAGPGKTWLVTSFIEGDTITEPPFPVRFAEQIAELLAGIHAVDPDLPELGFLEDGYDQTRINIDAWACSTHLPESELDYWKTLESFLPKTPEEPRVLLHGDYWPGNLIWQEGKIAGVTDWEDAHRGHPVADMANCRFELFMIGGPKLADAFSEAYRDLQPEVAVDRLAFWELYASVLLLRRARDWGLEPEAEQAMIESAMAFAEQAKRQLTGT